MVVSHWGPLRPHLAGLSQAYMQHSTAQHVVTTMMCEVSLFQHIPHELEMTMLGEAQALKRMMADMTCIIEKQIR